MGLDKDLEHQVPIGYLIACLYISSTPKKKEQRLKKLRSVINQLYIPSELL